MSTDEQRTVQARIKDPELLEAVEAAEERHGTTTAALEAALREAYLEDEDDTEGLSTLAVRGYRELRKHGDGERSRIGVGVAESVVANACNIKKEDVRASVFEPLRRHGKIGLFRGVRSVDIIVDPKSRASESRITDPVSAPAGPTDADARLAEIEAAEVSDGAE